MSKILRYFSIYCNMFKFQVDIDLLLFELLCTQTDRQTHRQTPRQQHRHKDRQIHRHEDRQLNRQLDGVCVCGCVSLNDFPMKI